MAKMVFGTNDGVGGSLTKYPTLLQLRLLPAVVGEMFTD